MIPIIVAGPTTGKTNFERKLAELVSNVKVVDTDDIITEVDPAYWHLRHTPTMSEKLLHSSVPQRRRAEARIEQWIAYLVNQPYQDGRIFLTNMSSPSFRRAVSWNAVLPIGVFRSDPREVEEIMRGRLAASFPSIPLSRMMPSSAQIDQWVASWKRSRACYSEFHLLERGYYLEDVLASSPSFHTMLSQAPGKSLPDAQIDAKN